jgi:hypothetical protein
VRWDDVCCWACRELTCKDKGTAQAELAATIKEKQGLRKQVDVRIADFLKVLTGGLHKPTHGLLGRPCDSGMQGGHETVGTGLMLLIS